MKPEHMQDEHDLFRQEISSLDAGDFDGHTCFKYLTPEQRLDWLAELVVFVYECRTKHTKSLL